ncbi:MAG TPA: glycosyltransferase, partial [Bacteroidales bacterium]|nr:glycosyltransferase [Bacteroidales bacterium]
LSCNGAEYLKKKIDWLLRELESFPLHEFFILDDGSTDGSQAILEQYTEHPGVRLIFHDRQHGIPFSMNLGVQNASYEIIVFFDQRQEVLNGSLRRIIEPFADERVVAVSGCISHIDRDQHTSWLRTHENYLKMGESRLGSLIGVYGPFYAVRRNCYSPIPEKIILDDLWLSLKILPRGFILISPECLITDDNHTELYDLKRVKRYVEGFGQIAGDRELFRSLPPIQRTMLIWHKYFRLGIPLVLAACYFTAAILAANNMHFLLLFGVMTLLGILSVWPGGFLRRLKLINLVRINLFYAVALTGFIVGRLPGWFRVSAPVKG